MVSAMVALITAAGALFNYLLTLRISADMAKLREEIGTRAETDRREIERWAGDTFLRSDLANAKLEAIRSQLHVIELQLERERELRTLRT